MWRVLKMSGRPLNLGDHCEPQQPCNWNVGYSPRVSDAHVLLRSRCNLVERSQEWQMRLNAVKDSIKQSPDVGSGSSTQSSTGIITPATEDWSEIGSMEVKGARDLADAFARSLDMLLNGSHVEKAPNAVLGAEWSASAYEQCNKFMEDFMDTICGSEEEEKEECTDKVVQEDKKGKSKDEAFEAIMGNMGADVILADIARLVFLWTKSERFWDIERPV